MEVTARYINIPQEMKAAAHWVNWGREFDTKTGKPSKAPLNSQTGEGAKANDVSTWSTYENAIKYAEAHNCGVGFEFGVEPSGFVGIDLDHVIRPDGSIEPFARKIVDLLDSYTEISPGGDGLHIFCIVTGKIFQDRDGGQVPGPVEGTHIELYEAKRYFTVTGNVYKANKPVNERTEAVRALYAQCFKKKEAGQEKKLKPSTPSNMANPQFKGMTVEDTISYLHEHATTDYLSRDESDRGYLCPICGSGSGPKGTGISTKDGIHFTCWAGCFTNADIIDIIAQKNGINPNDFTAKLESACLEFGIDRPERTLLMSERPKSLELEPPANFEASANFFRHANEQLGRTDYHRGISLRTLNHFHVGYVEHWKHPKTADNSNVPYSPRLIIPNDEGGYLARDTRANLTDSQEKYSKSRVLPTGLFNSEALKQDSQPVYIVEGEIDALSIIDEGGQAVALCSVANVKKLIETVRANPPKTPLIISLDTDGAGEKAAKELENELARLELSSYRHELPDEYKDANDFLMKDKDSFCQWVAVGKNPDEALERKTRELIERVEREAVAYKLNNFLETVRKNREGRAIPTGFYYLDNILDGGLYPGLYCVGAISSLGKTSFILQMADNIAKAGHGVLFFSLEMSRNELIARTLSRETLIRDIEQNGSKDHAKTTRGVLRGIYNEAEQKLISEAIEQYSEWGKRINITEGVGDVGIKEITDKVKEYIAYREAKDKLNEAKSESNAEGFKSFVVMIDYLQIIAPYNDKATDKQNTDKAVLELKRLSRDLQIPVIGVSSFNRENYLAPVSMASFKESGAIEYSSDVLIGLQYKGWDFKKDENEKGETETTRKARLIKLREQIDFTTNSGGAVEIQVKILKNRNGRRGSLLFNYSPMFNYYKAIREE